MNGPPEFTQSSGIFSLLPASNHLIGGNADRQENRSANSQAIVFPLAHRDAEAMPIVRTNRVRTLEDIREELTKREKDLIWIPFPLSQVRVERDHIIVGDTKLRLRSEGLRRLCKSFQAPINYLTSMPPRLRARVLQHHFRSGRLADSKLTDKKSCIVSRGDRFVALGRTDLFPLDNAPVIQAICDGIGADAQTLEITVSRLQDGAVSLDIVSPKFAKEVRLGDVVRAGLHIEHSQLDGYATQVMAFVHRLICSNGLIQRQCLGETARSTPRTRRLPSDHPEARQMQMAQIRKLVAETWSGLGKRLETIRRLRDKGAEAQ